jgi:hypothetical protein
MRTDDDLTTLLRRGFTQATADLDPEPDLVRAVRRRYVRARRRRLAAGMAVPAAVLAAGSGLALAGWNIPNHTAVAVQPPAPATSVTPRTAPPASVPKPASYKVVALHQHSAPSNCPANATAPVGKSENPAGAWFWTKGTCVFVGISVADTKPADAVPVQIKGYPGLYGTLQKGVRTIYAPTAPGPYDQRGGWIVLTMPANAPQETAVRMMISPANGATYN